MPDEKHPLLVAYDKALHDETVTARAADKECWYSYEKAHFKPASDKPSMTAQPTRVHPKLLAYRATLDAVTERFSTENPTFFFWYTGSKIKLLSKGVKADAIEHKTEIHRIGE